MQLCHGLKPRFRKTVEVFELDIMALNFDKTEQISERTKDIVSGYLKQCQVLLPNQDNPYFDIPKIVRFTILMFYHYPEHFTAYRSTMQVNKDKTSVQYIGTAYINLRSTQLFNGLSI